jgi:hypothetical protein
VLLQEVRAALVVSLRAELVEAGTALEEARGVWARAEARIAERKAQVTKTG